jgi:hypothetical protein
MALKISGSSVWNLFHLTILAPQILRWLLDFWTVCVPLDLGTVCISEKTLCSTWRCTSQRMSHREVSKCGPVMSEWSNVQASKEMKNVWQYEVHRELPVSEVCLTTSYLVERKLYLEWQPVYCWVGRTQKEVVMGYLQVPDRNFLRGTGENHKKTSARTVSILNKISNVHLLKTS